MHPLEQLAAANGGLVTVPAAAAVGVDRRRLAEYAQKGLVTRVARGVYTVGTVLPDPRPIVASARATLSHHSAAAWWGVDLPAPPRVVHMTVPRNRGRRRDAIRGVQLHRYDLSPGDVSTLRGLPVTTPLRTALDIARCESTESGVAVLDAFLRAKLITAVELDRAAERVTGPGRSRAQRATGLADAGAGSILESLTRVLLRRHSIPAPQTQYWIRENGRTGRVDFAWPDHRVVLETDGYEFHASYGPFQADRRRWSALSSSGWQVGVVTWLDVITDQQYVVALVRNLLDIQHTNVTSVA